MKKLNNLSDAEYIEHLTQTVINVKEFCESFIACCKILEFAYNLKFVQSEFNKSSNIEKLLRQTVEDKYNCLIYNKKKSCKLTRFLSDFEKAKITKEAEYDVIKRSYEDKHKENENIIHQLSEILDLNIQVHHVDKFKVVLLVQFANYKFNSVSLEYNIEDNEFKLLSIKPEHPNIKSLQEFLELTGDVSGLLSCAEKYFKEKIESSCCCAQTLKGNLPFQEQ